MEMNDMARFESCIEAPLISSQDFAHEMTDQTSNECSALELECLFDIFCETDTKLMEGLSDDAIRVLSQPDNEKSRKIYTRYQNFFKKYMVDNGGDYGEITLVNFFAWMKTENKYSPGSFWCIFSCIRTMVLVESSIDIKTYPLLRKTIKTLTVKHLKKKADIFESKEIKKILTEKKLQLHYFTFIKGM